MWKKRRLRANEREIGAVRNLEKNVRTEEEEKSEEEK